MGHSISVCIKVNWKYCLVFGIATAAPAAIGSINEIMMACCCENVR